MASTTWLRRIMRTSKFSKAAASRKPSRPPRYTEHTPGGQGMQCKGAMTRGGGMIASGGFDDWKRERFSGRWGFRDENGNQK